MSTQRNRVRIEQTRRELDHLAVEISDWLKRRIKADKLRQYQTQLKTLEAVLICALRNIRTSLDGLTSDTVGDVYCECRIYDRRLVWVRRIWNFFRNKFDQRDDAVLGPLLGAADEIVWSCYTGAFENAQAGFPSIVRGPTPLPYVEPRYSPQAIPRVEPPPELKSEADSQFIQQFLRELPIPVVSLPPSCITAPWWLIYLGHETGHHVQYDLLPKSELVASFGELLKAAVSASPNGGEKAAHRWQKWQMEVFADVFSIFNLGQWAVWAMTELEMADELTMLRSKTLYPSPVVRLSLLSAVADRLGLEGTAALQGLKPEQIASLQRTSDEGRRQLCRAAAEDLQLVDDVAEAVVKRPLGGLVRFDQLCDFRSEDFMDGGAVYHWKEGFCGREVLTPDRTLRAARLVISGAAASWAEFSTIEDAVKRNEAQAKLAENMVPMIANSREEGTRVAPSLPEVDAEALGNALARLLLEAHPGTLEQ